MKNLVLFLFIISTIFPACKKSSSDKPAPTGYYIKIDNDSRQLGDVPSSDVNVIQTEDPNEIQLIISISKKIENIDDSKNQYLSMYVILNEGGPSNTEYTIVNMSTPPPSSASVTVILQGNDISAQ